MRGWWILVLLVLAAGALLRTACLSAELWLDELWSWQLARGAGGVAGVFALKHDNNHHLNSLWLAQLPAGSSWPLFRLHTLAAGLGSIVLAARLGRRFGAADGLFAALLVAACGWLVLASAEARGYTLAVFFALAALDALWSYLDHRSRAALLGFWAASILGFLAHLTFVHAYLGFIVWSHRRFARERTTTADELRRLLICHGPVAAFFVPFYLVSLRGLVFGGGPPAPTGDVIARLISVGLGGPAEGWERFPWLLGAMLLLTTGLWRLHREGRDIWLFFLVAVAVSPALFLIRRTPFLFERYFFVSFVFFLLLVGHVLGTLWRAGGPARGLSLLVLLAFLAGNVRQVLLFHDAGRGQFHQALAWIAAADPGEEVIVTGDHDFRVQKYVEFYASSLDDPTRLVYRSRTVGGAPADWLLAHRLDGRHPPAAEERDEAGNVYRLVQAYPSRGPFAWGWFVYRRQASGST